MCFPLTENFVFCLANTTAGFLQNIASQIWLFASCLNHPAIVVATIVVIVVIILDVAIPTH